MTPEQWKKEFWGDEMYAKLLRIKKKWDPLNKFSCNECVGSDWDPQTEDVVLGNTLRRIKVIFGQALRMLYKSVRQMLSIKTVESPA